MRMAGRMPSRAVLLLCLAVLCCNQVRCNVKTQGTGVWVSTVALGLGPRRPVKGS